MHHITALYSAAPHPACSEEVEPTLPPTADQA
jgi:hypothetical protein